MLTEFGRFRPFSWATNNKFKPTHNGRNTMRRTCRHAMHATLAFIITSFAVSNVATPAVSQDGGWITLFDEKNLDGWDRVGESNWHLEDGLLVADKMPGKEAGYLVSKSSYKNFIVRVEFWPSNDANSGIYFRCLDPKK